MIDAKEVPKIALHRPRDPHTAYHVFIGLSATANVTRLIAGHLPDAITISYSVNPYADEEQLFESSGKYLVFLSVHGDIQLLTRETIWKVTEDKVSWFGKTVNNVVNEIRAYETPVDKKSQTNIYPRSMLFKAQPVIGAYCRRLRHAPPHRRSISN